MTAKEAKQKAISLNAETNSKQLRDVYKAIEKAAAEGLFHTYFYERLTNTVEAALLTEGYKVTQFPDQRDGVTVTISWE